jgi:hypothetical protein
MHGIKVINSDQCWLMGEGKLGGHIKNPEKFLYVEKLYSYTRVYRLKDHILIESVQMDGIPKFYGDLELYRQLSHYDYLEFIKEFNLHPYA